MAVDNNVTHGFEGATGRLERDASKGERRRRAPVPEKRKYLFVSVDDHLCEPRDIFEGRLPAKFASDAPHVENADGVDYWVYEGRRVPLTVGDGRQTWDPSDWDYGNTSFDELRPGVYDIHERIKDMDLVGCYASLSFPSSLIGFSGQRFVRMEDKDLGLACMRAYNDWIFEAWYGPYPDRIILTQVAWLLDADIAAQEIRHNAARGFTSVCFSENPEKLGLPSLRTGYWDPFFRACEETQTVINLHIGSSSQTVKPSTDSPVRVLGTLFPVNALMSCVDWLFSHVPHEFPDIRIALSEGGIGWLPMILDRFTHQRSNHQTEFESWTDAFDGDPREILQRNFWYCSLFDPSALEQRHRIGIDRIMMEMDFPHSDSTWPKCQDYLEHEIGSFPEEDIDRLTHLNACALYRLPVPPRSYLAGVGSAGQLAGR